MNFVQFKIGEFLFPILEPIFRKFENKNTDVKKHIDQAVDSLGNKNTGAALLNLNRVLNLHPNHFMARVYRGRIHIRERRYRQAAEDYIQANKISRYRFIHYDLYREYFISLNQGIGHLSASIIQNFNLAFEVLEQSRKNLQGETEMNLDSALKQEISPEQTQEPEERGLDNGSAFTQEEWFKFQQLNPITRKEIENTDWNKLIEDLTSRTGDL